MTGKFLRPGALFLLVVLAAGCFNPAAVQKMQEANWAYSMSPNFKMDRIWRIAILPPSVNQAGTSGLYDHAGLLLMKPGRFRSLTGPRWTGFCRSSSSGVPASLTRAPQPGWAS